MNIEPMKKFLKRRNLIEKIFIGVSSTILILAVVDTIKLNIRNGKDIKVETKINEPNIKKEEIIQSNVEVKEEVESPNIKKEEQIESITTKPIEQQVSPITSNLEKIKADFAGVYSDSKVTSISKEGATLKILIQEPDSEYDIPVDETAISVYTEEALNNVGEDIKTIDITVKRPSSSVRAKLDMSRLITTNLGSYFDIEYIMKNMYQIK